MMASLMDPDAAQRQFDYIGPKNSDVASSAEAAQGCRNSINAQRKVIKQVDTNKTAASDDVVAFCDKIFMPVLTL